MNLQVEGGVREFNSNLPRDLVTGTGDDPRPHLRVDPGQTGFWEGRMFRSFIEFNITAGSTVAARFVAAADFILHKQAITIDDGHLRFAAVLDGTPGGTFTAAPIIGMNRMANRPTPLYTPVSAVGYGGSITGGTEVEVIRLKTQNSSSAAVTVGRSTDNTRGLPAGTYYLKFQNIGAGAVQGVYEIEWEEYSPRSSKIY